MLTSKTEPMLVPRSRRFPFEHIEANTLTQLNCKTSLADRVSMRNPSVSVLESITIHRKSRTGDKRQERGNKDGGISHASGRWRSGETSGGVCRHHHWRQKKSSTSIVVRAFLRSYQTLRAIPSPFHLDTPCLSTNTHLSHAPCTRAPVCSMTRTASVWV